MPANVKLLTRWSLAVESRSLRLNTIQTQHCPGTIVSSCCTWVELLARSLLDGSNWQWIAEHPPWGLRSWDSVSGGRGNTQDSSSRKSYGEHHFPTAACFQDASAILFHLWKRWTSAGSASEISIPISDGTGNSASDASFSHSSSESSMYSLSSKLIFSLRMTACFSLKVSFFSSLFA